jgi:tetratricopeptide (TPR) repeat protein
MGMWFRTGDATHSTLVAALLLAYLIQNLFSFDTINTNGVVFMVLAYVAWLCGGKRRTALSPPVLDSQMSPVRGKGWLAIGTVGLMIAGSYWYLVKVPCESNLLLARAIASSRTQVASGRQRYVFREGISDLYQQASEYQTTGCHEVREQYANYAARLARASNIPLKDRVRLVEQAISLLEESVTQEPSDARHCLYIASLTNATLPVLRESNPALAQAVAEKTLVLLQQAENLTPTRPQVYIERSKILSWAGRTAEAITALEKAVSLSPWVKELHADLAKLYISAGRPEDAATEQKKAE